ncbi:metallophosphoesterase [Solirubrobacter sp. CPCC 204708]|uniref:Metallophosphoesterase n=1 Tax=Solirubrobacter deserti TaxID=2282478 RepID=A0ABT4RMV1_9ACTN|nr:metallophosphoesterase [Solirubrobacter deserti]MBE2320149.1 metallophosphoesterase [Solirubrobacter deserti]MDA0139869.1 metallophosphoesterase [Solirubrobacter deserti]
MKTLVVSDLHIGHRARDLLRRPDLQEPLLDALDRVDRFVILGDGLELREAAHRDAVDGAAPFFAAVGSRLGPDKEFILLSGNHDHGLAAGWIDSRLQTEAPGFLGLEQRFDAHGPLASALAEAARPARLRFAYPGLWLRDDVYAFHGHYADAHATVPTFERVLVGAMARWVTPLPSPHATADDYESVLSPLYAWLYALTQRTERSLVSHGGGASSRSYKALTAERTPRSLALRAGYRGAVASLNAIGLGPLQPGLSPTALRRGYLHGISEVIRRLQIPARHVIWGHSHRSGPWPTDDPAEWQVNGTRIHNTGSWVYQPHFLTPEPNGSPYWPGTAVLVDSDGPPRLLRLLGDRGHEELRPRDPA